MLKAGNVGKESAGDEADGAVLADPKTAGKDTEVLILLEEALEGLGLKLSELFLVLEKPLE